MLPFCSARNLLSVTISTSKRDKHHIAMFMTVFGGLTPDGVGRAPKGLNDGKGFVFISHQGDVFPSGFLPATSAISR